MTHADLFPLHRRLPAGHVFPILALATVGLALAAPALAQSAQPRSAVPIRETVIAPIGTPRYSITVLVNGVPVEAGLDTGSVGLRLLPRAVQRAGVDRQGPPTRYSYSSGVQLDGHKANAMVQIGDVRGGVTLQAIDTVGCVNGANCPAGHLSPSDYGLMGSGQPRQGFPAIIGVRLAPGEIPSTLSALGVHRWIVHLPPRGGGQGVLILNPDERDVAGFVALRAGAGAPGTVAGCAMILAPGAQRFCGPTLLDTGAPGLTIHGAQRPPRWQPDLPAAVSFFGASGGDGPGVAFRTGDTANGGDTRFVAALNGGRSLSAGTMPFYAYDVLFDEARNVIALRPNPAGGSGLVRPMPR